MTRRPQPHHLASDEHALPTDGDTDVIGHQGLPSSKGGYTFLKPSTLPLQETPTGAVDAKPTRNRLLTSPLGDIFMTSDTLLCPPTNSVTRRQAKAIHSKSSGKREEQPLFVQRAEPEVLVVDEALPLVPKPQVRETIEDTSRRMNAKRSLATHTGVGGLPHTATLEPSEFPVTKKDSISDSVAVVSITQEPEMEIHTGHSKPQNESLKCDTSSSHPLTHDQRHETREQSRKTLIAAETLDVVEEQTALHVHDGMHDPPDAAIAISRPLRVATPLSLKPLLTAVIQPPPPVGGIGLDALDRFLHGGDDANANPLPLRHVLPESREMSKPFGAVEPRPPHRSDEAPMAEAPHGRSLIALEGKSTTFAKTSGCIATVREQRLPPEPIRHNPPMGGSVRSADAPPVQLEPVSLHARQRPSATPVTSTPPTTPPAVVPRLTSDTETQRRITAHKQRQKDLDIVHQKQSDPSYPYEQAKTEKKRAEQNRRGDIDRIRAELYMWNAQLRAEADEAQRRKHGAMDGV
jgi:hypothetical protein